MASSGMILRNLALVGKTSDHKMPDQHKPTFEEGCAILLSRWTALQLAIQNEWGGNHSKDKARDLLKDVIQWFYENKDREQSDLEVILDEALQCDFNVLADDDSPYQVSRSLVNMHNQVATGDYSYIEQLKATPVPMPEACRQVFAPEDEENDSSSSDEDDEDEDGSGDMDVDDTMDEDQPTNNNGPIIDEDGFQLVEKKGRGRR